MSPLGGKTVRGMPFAGLFLMGCTVMVAFGLYFLHRWEWCVRAFAAFFGPFRRLFAPLRLLLIKQHGAVLACLCGGPCLAWAVRAMRSQRGWRGWRGFCAREVGNNTQHHGTRIALAWAVGMPLAT